MFRKLSCDEVEVFLAAACGELEWSSRALYHPVARIGMLLSMLRGLAREAGGAEHVVGYLESVGVPGDLARTVASWRV